MGPFARNPCKLGALARVFCLFPGSIDGGLIDVWNGTDVKRICLIGNIFVLDFPCVRPENGNY